MIDLPMEEFSGFLHTRANEVFRDNPRIANNNITTHGGAVLFSLEVVRLLVGLLIDRESQRLT